MSQATKLKISGLSKSYGSFVALSPTDLEVRTGEFLSLLGPSGSGKTTLLTLIAGLSTPDQGRLLINNKDVTYSAPYERDIGMVFQNYALFPHMTILENIAFPLKMRKISASEALKQAHEALDLVRLPQVANRFPKELSGGQQQRIALARCLVYKPSIVLMDEPLGALDKKLRDQMQLEIKRIHRESEATIVYVTHDQEEAMTMSDRICLMNAGQIEQLGTPADLYFRPKTVFVADFLGESNLFKGTVTELKDGLVTVNLESSGNVVMASAPHSLQVGSSVKVMVRPQNVSIASSQRDCNSISGIVQDQTITGSLTKIYVASNDYKGPDIVLSHPTSLLAESYASGQSIQLQWDTQDAVAVLA